MRFITCIEEWEQGGPVPVDLIHLRDGRIVGIDGEYIVLYKSLADFEDAETTERPTIYLTQGESK